MELKYIFSVNAATGIIETPDNYIVFISRGILFLDKKSHKEIYCTNDFCDPDDGKVTPDSKYLVVRNAKNGFYCYDLKSRKQLSKAIFGEAVEVNYLGFCYSLDGKSMYALIATPKDQSIPPLGNEDYINNTTVELRHYELPSLKLLDTLPCKEKYMTIKPVKFLNGCVLTSVGNHLSFFDGKAIVDYPSTKTSNYEVLVDEKKEQFYSQTDFGVKIYNKQFQDTNILDLISDSEVVVNDTLYNYLNMDPGSAMNTPAATKTVFKEKILDLYLIDDKIVLLAAECLQRYSKISVYDTSKGKPLAEFKMNCYTNQIFNLNKGVAFLVKGDIYVLEMQD
ncbi:MAG: hypothetical protein WCR56_00905 [Bacilli bacterium]|jgi:hypothetical protein